MRSPVTTSFARGRISSCNNDREPGDAGARQLNAGLCSQSSPVLHSGPRQAPKAGDLLIGAQ
jgi:hypothetical protein